MKALILVVVAAFYVLPARAEGEAPAPAKTETIEVLPEASTGLFERVREAHIRAIHKGVVSAKTS